MAASTGGLYFTLVQYAAQRGVLAPDRLMKRGALLR
jgi:hypothetical protein